MRRILAPSPDVDAWKQQVTHLATAFDLLALAASATAHLAHLASATPHASSAIPPLSQVVEALSALAAAPAFDASASTATLQRLLRDTRAMVDLTRHQLQRQVQPGPRPLEGAGFLLSDFLPGLERAVNALERLQAQLPLDSPASTQLTGPSDARPPTRMPLGRTGTTPPPAPVGQAPTG